MYEEIYNKTEETIYWYININTSIKKSARKIRRFLSKYDWYEFSKYMPKFFVPDNKILESMVLDVYKTQEWVKPSVFDTIIEKYSKCELNNFVKRFF